MARTSNITFGQVAAIADAMKAAGTRPTARAVRESIGSGSLGTIHKLLQQWTGKGNAQDEGETEAAELPMHIQNALMDFVGTEIATACEQINEELQAASEALDDIAQDNQRAYIANENLQRELDQCHQERAAAMAMLNTTREELKDAHKAREKLTEEKTALLRDLDRTQRQVELFTGYAPELDAARTALAVSENKRIEAEKAAAVLAAELNASERRAEEAIKSIGEMRNHAKAKDEETRTANKHYEACAARMEAAAREIESLRKPKPSPTAKAVNAKPAKVINANS